jgi:hypothetical protein
MGEPWRIFLPPCGGECRVPICRTANRCRDKRAVMPVLAPRDQRRIDARIGPPPEPASLRSAVSTSPQGGGEQTPEVTAFLTGPLPSDRPSGTAALTAFAM